MVKKKKKKLISLPKLKKKAWSLWSKTIRKGMANHQGYAICYTCGIKKPWRELHAGHFIHNALDFDPRNIRPQCSQCNTFLHGNLGVCATKLVKEYGLEYVECLQSDAKKKGNNYSRKELENIISSLKR